MSTPVSLNGTSYSIPATGEGAWGTEVSNYLIAIASGLLSKAGGSFTLTADADFGANYGLKAVYYKSRGTVSTAGILRLANNESIGWRDQANSADLELKVNTSDVLEFGGNPLVTLALGTAEYVLKMNSGGTAYEWGQILNAGISASAGIDASKISAGVVSNTEFDYLNGVTSAIQTQLDALTTGAASSTDNALARFDSTTGKIIQNSVAILSDAGALSGLTQLDVDNLRLDGNTLSSTDTNGDINLTPDGTGKTATTRPLEVSGTSSYVKIPSLTTSQRDALSAAAGQVIFNSDNSKYEAYDGSAWSELGSSGASGINYIENHDFESTPDESTPDGWTDQDTDFAITAESTNAIRGTVSGYLEATASASANDVIYYAFTLDRGDKNKLMRLSFDYEGDSNYTADDISVDIYDVTNATAITPSVTNIGAGPGRFEALFVTTDSTSYRLRFTLNTGSTALALAIDDVRVTPELTVTANPMTGWISFSTVSNLTTNIKSQSGFYRRVGDTMEVMAGLSFNGDNDDGLLIPALPTGFTVNTDYIPAITGTQNETCIGGWYFRDASASPDDTWGGPVACDPANGALTLAFSDGASDLNVDTSSLPVDITTDDCISWHFKVPIAEWAGSVVTTANSRVKYYATSDTWDGDGTTTISGPEGQSMAGALTTRRKKTITTEFPIQPTDKIEVQIRGSSTGHWVPAVGFTAHGSVFGGIPALQYDGATAADSIGVSYRVTGSNTIEVYFGTEPFNDGTFSSAWSASWDWRVMVASNPLGIGTGLATATQAGAVESYVNTTWTPTENAKSNLTGTSSFNTATYTKIGDIVFVRIDNISGLSTTSTATRTYIEIVTTDLPGTTNSTQYYGSAKVKASGSEVAAAVGEAGSGNSNVFFAWKSDGTGSTGITSVFFHYEI